MSAGQGPRASWRAVPFLPIILALGACISAGLWFFYMNHALAETKHAAWLMLMPTPPVFVTVPALFLATLVATVVLAVASAAIAAAGPSPRRSGGGGGAGAALLSAAGASNTLLFLLVLWLAGMLAVTALWAGAALVSQKSTADAAVTLRSVDPAIHRLIFQASGGAINGTETGFIVTVGDPKGPKRDVDIGKSSCSLFCFVFARAMMSDSSECFCNVEIMGKIHDMAGYTLKRHLVPAAICALVALATALGLLTCGAGRFGGAAASRRAGGGARGGEAASNGGGGGAAGYKVHSDSGSGGAASDYYGTADQARA